MSNAMAGHATKAVEFSGKWFTFHKVPYANGSATAPVIKVSQSAIKATVVMPASGGPTPTLASASTDGTKTVTLAAAGTSSEGHVWVVCTHGSTLASGNQT